MAPLFLLLAGLLFAAAPPHQDLDQLFRDNLSADQMAALGPNPSPKEAAEAMTGEQRNKVKEALRQAEIGADGDRLRAIGERYLVIDGATGNPSSEALRISDALRRRDPMDSAGPTLAAATFQQAGDYQSAIAGARTALKLNPNDKAAWAVLKLSEDRVKKIEPKEFASSRPSSNATGHQNPTSSPGLNLPIKPVVRATLPAPPPNPNAVDLRKLLPAYVINSYSESEKLELANAISVAANSTSQLYKERPSTFTDAMSGWSGSGALANIPVGARMIKDQLKAALGMDPDTSAYPTSRTCLDHAERLSKDLANALPADSNLKVNWIRIGKQPWLEHHAVLIRHKEKSVERSGVVIDPWRKQSAKAEDFVSSYGQFKDYFLVSIPAGEQITEIK